MHYQREFRSLLYTPGSSERKMEKALSLESDGVIFDLEDAVSPDQKQTARKAVVAFLGQCPRSPQKELLVRVNQVSSHLGIRDILAIAPARPDSLVIPKATPREVVVADVILAGIEAEHGMARGCIGLIPLIETAEGIETLPEILRCCDRIIGVHLGAEDLTKDLGIARTREGAEIHYARSRVVMAARAADVTAIDTPFADYGDPEGLEADVARAKSMGMTAKVAIHPGQVACINTAFSPTDEEVAQARRILAVYEDALAKGLGACSLDGKMIDVPIAERAQKVLDRMARIDGRQNRTAR